MSKFPPRGRGEGRGWPPDAVEILERLWKAGDLSASQIAGRLGVTRNAVLGKVFRLGLSGQRTPAARRPTRPAERPRRRSPSTCTGGRRLPPRNVSGIEPATGDHPAADPIQPVAATEELLGLVPHLEDLGPGACHWPCGDPHDPSFAFCGRPTSTPPYCVAHARIAYRPGAGASLSQILKLAARAP